MKMNINSMFTINSNSWSLFDMNNEHICSTIVFIFQEVFFLYFSKIQENQSEKGRFFSSKSRINPPIDVDISSVQLEDHEEYSIGSSLSITLICHIISSFVRWLSDLSKKKGKTNKCPLVRIIIIIC